MNPLTVSDIEQAFSEMGEILFRKMLIGEIAVYGGAAIQLTYQVELMTHDVDVTIENNHGAIQAAAHEVAKKHHWLTSWLSEAVSMYISDKSNVRFYKNFPSDSRVGLRVYVAAPEYILAMKLQALRIHTRDYDDAIFLAKKLGYRTVDSLIRLHNKFFQREKLTSIKIVAINELVEKMNANAP